MTVQKRYVLRLFISLSYITENVVDRNNRWIVATAPTVEHAIKNSLECGRSYNAKQQPLLERCWLLRLKMEGVEQGRRGGIHVDVNKEIEKTGFKNNGFKVVFEDNEDNPSWPSY